MTDQLTTWSQVVSLSADKDPIDDVSLSVTNNDSMVEQINSDEEFYMIGRNPETIASRIIKQVEIEHKAIELLHDLQNFVDKGCHPLLQNLTIQDLLVELYPRYERIL